MNARMLLPASIALVVIVSLLAFATDDNDRVSEGDPPNFSGKTLLVYTSRVPRYPTWIMVDSQLERIGNRLFLSGKYADTRRKQDWRSGLETHVAWDAVTTYQVLTSEEYEGFLDDAHAGR